MAQYGNNYYEREVICESPFDSYPGCNRVEADYGRPRYPIGYHQHHPHTNVVADVVYESSTIPSYNRHHPHTNVVTDVVYESSTIPSYNYHHYHPHTNVVTDVVYESSTIPSHNHHYHNHHYGGGDFVERKEERIIYENDYDPYRRTY